MTNRDFFKAIASNETLSDDLRTFAKDAITKLDNRNAKRASTPSKTAVANEPIKASILNFLGTRTSALSSDIAGELGITVNKASSLCKQLVGVGKVKVSLVSVPKVGKRNSWSLVVDDPIEDDEAEDEMGE